MTIDGEVIDKFLIQDEGFINVNLKGKPPKFVNDTFYNRVGPYMHMLPS